MKTQTMFDFLNKKKKKKKNKNISMASTKTGVYSISRMEVKYNN